MSSTTIHIDDFLKTKVTMALDNDDCSYEEVYESLKAHPDVHAVTRRKKRTLQMFNVAMLQIDAHGNYFFEFEVPREASLMTDFSITSDDPADFWVEYQVGSNYLKSLKQFSPLVAQYQMFQIRFFFGSLPKQGSKIQVDMTDHHFQRDVSRELVMKYSSVFTDELRYKEGMCYALL
jgi:hypothetical protein